MKAKLINTVLFSLLFAGEIFAQDVTTVRANNSDISDNLNLQAVASIFGDSQDLEDFERRLNDPDAQISNLDLNNDNRVDYLRVIEVTENNTHVVILQSVLAADTFQDVATIEVERDNNNNVTVQVVGDTYIYGSNYIYEPVYVVRPPMFNVFWASSYRPYYSPWYYGYYPTYYNYWAPYAPFRYRSHIHNHINVRNNYVYVNTGRSSRAVALYNTRRSNGYERLHPNNSFTSRNNNVSNRYQLEQTRSTAGTRSTRALNNSNTATARGTGVRNSGSGFSNSSRNTSSGGRSANSASVRGTTLESTNSASVRNTTAPSVRTNTPTRSFNNASSNSNSVRSTATPSRNFNPGNNNTVRSMPANNTPVRMQSSPAVRSQAAPAVRSMQSAPAVRSTPAAAPRQSAPAATPASRTDGGGRRG